METNFRRKNMKKKENCEERSPLRNLNGLRINTRNSNLSSSSSAPAASTFLISNNPSSSSSFHSSSTTHLDRKSKSLGKNEPSKSRFHRSEENEMPRKPFMQASRKDKPQFTTQRQNSSSNAKPTCKTRQRSNLSSVQGRYADKAKKGPQKFQEKMKTSTENDSGKRTFELNRASFVSHSNYAENSTPVSGRVVSGFGSPTLYLHDHETGVMDSVCERARANTDNNTSSAGDVKTPPVEPSVSPEIQCQSQSKMLLLKPAGTPVCYGAGHLLSGVSDKRRSRRRGSLRGGPEKATLFSDTRRDENVTLDLKESSIPSLAEASIMWHLSPCNVRREDHIIGSGSLALKSSPSIVCGNTLDFLCTNGGSGGSAGDVAVNRRSSNVISSPRKANAFPEILEQLSCNIDESFLATSPNAILSYKSLTRDSSILSDGNLSSGNIIQTPESDCSSDAFFGKSRLEVDLGNSVCPEIDPITETLERMKLSPRSEMLMWDAPGLGSHSANMGSPHMSLDPTQLQRNGDSVSSWVSDTTVDNLRLSQMRISWCDVLASKSSDFDCCCCCLSDEEIEGDESSKVTEAAEEKETCLNNDSVASVETKEDEFSPVLLDYEPCIPARGKGKLPLPLPSPNACAESICTDGGGLIASDDSDWTFFQETARFISN